MRQRSHRTMPGYVVILAACLLLRSLIPTGYMPGNLLAGEFAVLCPQGLPDSVLEELHGGHHGHDETVLDADRACPIGSVLLAAGPPPAEPVVAAIELIQPPLPATVHRAATSQRYHRYRPRAPPLQVAPTTT